MALGRTLTIARDDGTGTFTLLCVTESRSVEINNEEIDISKPDCLDPGSKLRRSLAYGMQSINVTAQGAFVSNATMKAVAKNAINQVVDTYQISVPGLGTFEGDGLMSVTFSGDKTNELQNDFRMSMTDDIVFVEEA